MLFALLAAQALAAGVGLHRCLPTGKGHSEVRQEGSLVLTSYNASNPLHEVTWAQRQLMYYCCCCSFIASFTFSVMQQLLSQLPGTMEVFGSWSMYRFFSLGKCSSFLRFPSGKLVQFSNQAKTLQSFSPYNFRVIMVSTVASGARAVGACLVS